MLSNAAHGSKWIWALTGTMLGAGLVGAWGYQQHLSSMREASAAGPFCDYGIRAAKTSIGSALPGAVAGTSMPALAQTTWIPKLNRTEPPGPAPEGMAWIPGGQFWMGTAEEHMPDARPWHRVYIDGFWMDKTGVTNEEFAAFVKSTGYVRVAEGTPRREDYPQALPERLVAGSVVFSPPDHPVGLDNHFRWWSYWLARTGGIRKVRARISRTG